MYQRQSDLVYYFGLGHMNDSLLRENARLRDKLAALKYSFDTLRDSSVTRVLTPADSIHPVQYAHYIFRTAKVINNSVGEENNYITLNRGSNDGIDRGMAVVSGTGVVGRVMNVSAHFSTVRSILSDLQPVSSRLKDGTTGIVRWNFEHRLRRPDALYMGDVPSEIKLHLGDSVFTTSYSFFPPDIMVGTISNSEIVKKTGKRLLTVRPATNFRNMQYVYVVENTMAKEQIDLEKKNNPEKPKEKGKKR